VHDDGSVGLRRSKILANTPHPATKLSENGDKTPREWIIATLKLNHGRVAIGSWRARRTLSTPTWRICWKSRGNPARPGSSISWRAQADSDGDLKEFQAGATGDVGVACKAAQTDDPHSIAIFCAVFIHPTGAVWRAVGYRRRGISAEETETASVDFARVKLLQEDN
jgi:hypothetical protein